MPHEDLDPLDAIRAIALALPGVEERVSHNEPGWFVGKRHLAAFADHHHDDRVAVWLPAPSGVQGALIAEAPDRFFRPPYVGVRGWVGVALDLSEPPDWAEVAEMVEAYIKSGPPLTQAAAPAPATTGSTAGAVVPAAAPAPAKK